MYFKTIFEDRWRFWFLIFLNNSKMLQNAYKTYLNSFKMDQNGHKTLNWLFVYSAGRAIVSRDGQTTQICCPTAQNTQKPTPTKESTKGGGRRRRPPPFVEAAEGRLLCGCWFLCILCCWATYLCCLAISWHYCPSSRVEQAIY